MVVVQVGVGLLLVLRAVLELGQVGGDRHHHPEHGRDERQRAEADQDREQAQLAHPRASAAGRRAPPPAAARRRRNGIGAEGSRSGRRDVVVVAHAIGMAPLGYRPDGHRGTGARMARSRPRIRSAEPPRRRRESSIGARCDRRSAAPVRRAPAGSRERAPVTPHRRRRRHRRRGLAGAQRRRLPARGRARGQARARAPAAGQARDRPDRARHPSRLHRRAAEAARVPGPRPHRRADHRRLHRARRRPERPLEHAAGARAGRDRRQRAHLPGAGDEGARPRAARGPLQRRVARHADGRPVRADAHRRPWPRSSSATTSPSASPPASRSRCSSCSIRCCRATTRWRSGPTSSSAAPTRSSTCCSGATSSAPTASPSR